MASLSDMLLQASMRNPHAGAGTTIAILVSFLLEASLKAWRGRRGAYRKLADDLAGWAVFAGDNPYVPIADGLRPRGVLGKALAVLPVCHIPAKTEPIPDDPAAEKAREKIGTFIHGFRFGNRYQYAKRLLRKEGIDFKVSQGFMRGFICVQQSDLARARAVLGDAGLPMPALLADTPMTINAQQLDALGMGSRELAQALEDRGFDAAAREDADEVVVTFDEAHDAAALTSALCALKGEPGATEEPQAGQGEEPDNEPPAGPQHDLHDYYGPATKLQRHTIDKLAAKAMIGPTLAEELRGMTSGQITDYFNTHPELGVPRLERSYKNGPHPYAAPGRGDSPRSGASIDRMAACAERTAEAVSALAAADGDKAAACADKAAVPSR